MSDEARITMRCDSCFQLDTDPRHHVLQEDGSVQTMHMDCCRDSGSCVDDHCHRILTASGEKRGDELLLHILLNGKPQTEPVTLEEEE